MNENLSTGLNDVNGTIIKNGAALMRTGKFAMTGKINHRIKDIPYKTQYVYFHDGAFKICKKRNNKNACSKRWMLNGYLIRRYGLKIINEPLERCDICGSNDEHVFKNPNCDCYEKKKRNKISVHGY